MIVTISPNTDFGEKLVSDVLKCVQEFRVAFNITDWRFLHGQGTNWTMTFVIQGGATWTQAMTVSPSGAVNISSITISSAINREAARLHTAALNAALNYYFSNTSLDEIRVQYD